MLEFEISVKALSVLCYITDHIERYYYKSHTTRKCNSFFQFICLLINAEISLFNIA